MPASRASGAARERCAILGYGRIGRLIAAALRADPQGPELVGILGRPAKAAAKGLLSEADFEPGAPRCSSIEEICALSPDVVVECASANALAALGPAVLASGADLVPLSLTAFADPVVEALLQDAAARGPGRIEIPSGAAGALGLIAAARAAGLTRVLFRQAYAPEIWRRTAAADMVDLDRLDGPRSFFQGTAREAAGLFPKNLNAATGVALAGLGLDRTTVDLVADPSLPAVRYMVELETEAGPVHLVIGPRPEPGPDLTAASVLALLHRRGARLSI